MIVNTSRFGQVEVDGQQVITFLNRILGLPRYKRYVLIQPGEESHFYWLHSVETPDLAFVVIDPSLFVSSHCVSRKPAVFRPTILTKRTETFVVCGRTCAIAAHIRESH